MNFFDLFISNDSEIGYALKELYNRLIDEEDLKIFWEKEDVLFTPEQIAIGIKNSEIFICCISQKYIESKSSKREIKFANELKKPIIAIMMDDLKLEDLRISMQPITVINCWNREIYKGRKYHDVLTSIKKNLRGFKTDLPLSDKTIQELTKKVWIELKSLAKNEIKLDDESSTVKLRKIIEKKSSADNSISLKNRKESEIFFETDNEDIYNHIERKLTDADISRIIQNWWTTFDFFKYKDEKINILENDKDKSAKDIKNSHDFEIKKNENLKDMDQKDKLKSDPFKEKKDKRIDFNEYRKSKCDKNENELSNEEIRKLASEWWGILKNSSENERERYNISTSDQNIVDENYNDEKFQNKVKFKKKKNEVLNFKNGDRYEGEVLDDLPHGYGSYTWFNQDTYIGEWVNGQRHGKGVLILENGESYEGEFLNNDFHGNGTYHYSSGEKFSGEWISNKPVYNNVYSRKYKD